MNDNCIYIFNKLTISNRKIHPSIACHFGKVCNKLTVHIPFAVAIAHVITNTNFLFQ